MTDSGNRCSECYAPLEDGAEFCEECGAPVWHEAPETPRRRCMNCDAPLEDDAEFCEECGMPVRSTTEPQDHAPRSSSASQGSKKYEISVFVMGLGIVLCLAGSIVSLVVHNFIISLCVFIPGFLILIPGTMNVARGREACNGAPVDDPPSEGHVTAPYTTDSAPMDDPQYDASYSAPAGGAQYGASSWDDDQTCMPEKPKRPLIVTILAVLYLIEGIPIMLASMVLFIIPGMTLFGIILLPVALVTILFGVGFLKGWRIMWYLGVIFTILSLIICVFTMILSLLAIIAVLINILVLYYLFRPNVKTFFLDKRYKGA